MKRLLKYLIGIFLLAVIVYNSVYFKKLDEVKAASTDFDARSFARDYFDRKLTPALNNGVELNQLVVLLQTDKEKAFSQHSNALGIGNIRFFLVKGEGEITSVNENDISVLIKTDTSQRKIGLATEFVFGNAIRDASGIIDINEFKNTMDFNNVSAEINKIVRTEVLPPFKANAKQGQIVQFVGAIELNRQHLSLDSMEVIPVSLKIIK